MAKLGELKRAAQVLGVASSTLRQHGWATASPACVQAVMDDPPDWLIVARQNRIEKRASSTDGVSVRASLDVLAYRCAW